MLRSKSTRVTYYLRNNAGCVKGVLVYHGLKIAVKNRRRRFGHNGERTGARLNAVCSALNAGFLSVLTNLLNMEKITVL